MQISKIYTYPIKGMRATELENAVLSKNGLPFDRRFMVLKVQEDGSHKNMAVAHFPEMTLYFPTIQLPEEGDPTRGTVTITYKPPSGDHSSLSIPLVPETEGLEQIEITLHGSPVTAYKMYPEYNAWLSSRFGFEVKLVHLGHNLRNVLMSTSGKADPQSSGWWSSITSKASGFLTGAEDDQNQITFADCAPYLVVSEKSMDDAHNRLPDGQKMDISKFRPNIIVAGAAKVWEEDLWRELLINDKTRILCEHNCGRCKSINIDYATGAPGTDELGNMLKKLNSNRRVDQGTKWSPVFGRYSFLAADSDWHSISVGDEVTVSKRLEETTKFDWPGLCTN
ncbi:MOSC domain-containing protein [Hortaea werneckii]|nr:MOSC domain-containing protein [Hortaea werneckii]